MPRPATAGAVEVLQLPPPPDSEKMGVFAPSAVEVLSNYEFTETSFRETYARFRRILKRRGCPGTVLVTGVLLGLHPGILRKYRRNTEYSLYGHLYQDYSTMLYDEVSKHLAQSRMLFAQYDMRPRGLRCPNLLWNDRILDALSQNDFWYESNEPIVWDNIVRVKKDKRRLIRNLYSYRSAKDQPSIPRIDKQIVRMPVTFPTDRMLANLWGIEDEKYLAKIYISLVKAAHARGDYIGLDLNMSHFSRFAYPMEMAIAYAKKKKPAVWLATMADISKWWVERSKVKFEIKEKTEGHLLVSDAPKTATILVRGAGIDAKGEQWFGRWKSVRKNSFIIKSARIPGIGIKPGSPGKLYDFLAREGFVVDESTGRERFAIYLDDIYSFDRNTGDEMRLLAKIEAVYAPLVRLWRWPNECRSAMSVNMEIDAVTVWDLLKRKKEM